MKTKTFKAQVKALDDGTEGTFEALVSVFDNVDLVGDRVVKGAFAKSLQRWEESGDPIPVVFSHQWDNLDAHIGEVLSAEETDDGLLIKAQLDVDDDDAAAKVHRLLSKRRIKEFSFAYDVIDEAKADGANELRELELIEVGPTLKGANPDTVLVGAKRRHREKVYAPLTGSIEELQQAIREAVRVWASDGNEDSSRYAFVEATFDDSVVFTVDDMESGETTHYQAAYTVDEDDTVTLAEPIEVTVEATIRAASRGAKAGRTLSAKNETKLREARDAIDAVLSSLENDPADAGDEAKQQAKPEDPEGGKGEEPAVRSPSDIRLSAEIEALDL